MRIRRMIVIEKEEDESDGYVRYYLAKRDQIHDELNIEYSHLIIPKHEFNDKLLIDWLNRELKDV